MPSRLVACKLLFFFFLILPGYFSHAQLNASFTATPTNGCSPIVVKFTDSSAGNPTAWKWDLGNGTVSFLRNPSVTYFTPGQYTVQLIISNAADRDTITKVQYITVYAKPVTEFSASAVTGCFPLPVSFKDMSTAGSGDISKWEWDFGDGINATGANPQHIYKSQGSFNVSLRVTNSFGCTNSITKSQYIQISSGVLANFDIKMSNSCKAPASINFTNTSNGNGVLSYLWDFGDGSGSILANPMHTYTNDGNYTVQLIVKNSSGCIDTLTRLNAIILGNTNAGFSAPSKVCEGNFVDIKNTSMPVAASVLWNFGDGTTSTDITPAKQYGSPGNYIIKMIVDFGACLDSVSKPIVVSPKPMINFTSDKTNDCKIPFIVNFTQSGVGAISYLWDFGDGTSSADKDPKHTYYLPGIHDVKLIAANFEGCSDTLIKPGLIQIQLPEVSISDLPAVGCAPFTNTFTSTVISTEPVISYQWNFGDGSTSSSVSPSHTFTQRGRYTISVIITTAGGCTDTATVVDGVIVEIKPVALFSANPRNGCANMPVNFSDLSTGKIDEWYWEFGDGNTSSEQNPLHIYTDTGYFNVSLTITNVGCSDSIKFDKYIHISPPVARFLVRHDCRVQLERVFIDKSIGADSWLWNFGDGDTSTLQNPIHNYPRTANYIVKLTVTNSATGCSFTREQMISVIAEKPHFTISDSVICKETAIDFKTFNINELSIKSYFWDFGDGISSSASTGPATHVYKLAGVYSVTLIINNDLGCSDTLIKPLLIHVDGPTAAFDPAISGSCLNSNITFNDNSSSDGQHNIQQWIWNYGDGISDTLLAPPSQHSYAVPGTFTISLKVVDSKGCTDAVIKPAILVISQPVADFKTNDSVSCPQKPVTFTNSSTGPNLTYLWDFGDGSTSSQINPVHQYAAVGVFSISLSITDKYGCTGYILKKDYITIVIPGASFLMSDSVSNCPPLVVNFTNTSTNAITSSWDFGDGTTSLINNPSHFYAVPGIYNVTLKVSSHGNCIDQSTKQIVVKGPSGSFNYTNIIGCVPLTASFKASISNTTFIVWDFNDGTTESTSDSTITHKYVNPGIYLPRIILADAGGCRVPIIGNDTIVVYGVQANFNISPVTICDSGDVKFNDSSVGNDLITSYLWSFDDGTLSDKKDPVHTYKKSGFYNTKLIVTTQFGCMDSLSILKQVKVVNSPQIAIAGGAGACIPANLNFTGNLLAADTSALSWAWDFDNGKTSALQNPPGQVYPVANTYTIKLAVTNSSGCNTQVAKTVRAFPIPDVNIIADSSVCKGKSINLSVEGAISYNWAPGFNLSCTNCANPIARPDSSIQYVAKGTSVDGCVASDSISISVKLPFEIQVSRRDTLCAGSSTVLNASGGERYVWSPSAGLNNPLLSNPVATPLQTTNYSVIASDNMGCYKDTGYVLIKVYPIPTVNAGDDKIINVGKTIDLLPVISSDVINVNWSPTSGIFRNSYPGVSVKPNESLEYTVEVSNTGGCMARDRVTVNVLCNNANFFVPNTFSPNGDGANDIFYLRGSGIFQIKNLKVFNRWGEVVFEKANIYANDISSGWDGVFKSKKLLPDVFIYTIDIVCDNNTLLTFKGNIALIR
ncbi:MAG: PKD domain-containing protein [Ginsengibacter sp.]